MLNNLALAWRTCLPL